MTLLQRLAQERLYFDGGTGTCLQARGLKPGETGNLEPHSPRGNYRPAQSLFRSWMSYH